MSRFPRRFTPSSRLDGPRFSSIQTRMLERVDSRPAGGAQTSIDPFDSQSAPAGLSRVNEDGQRYCWQLQQWHYGSSYFLYPLRQYRPPPERPTSSLQRNQHRLLKNRIAAAIREATSSAFREQVKKAVNPYGDGQASRRIVEVLKNLDFSKQLLNKEMTY